MPSLEGASFAQTEASDLADMIFSQAGKNKQTGTLTKAEWASLWGAVKNQISSSYATAADAFDAIDTDGSGKISFKELQTFLSDRANRPVVPAEEDAGEPAQVRPRSNAVTEKKPSQK